MYRTIHEVKRFFRGNKFFNRNLSLRTSGVNEKYLSVPDFSLTYKTLSTYLDMKIELFIINELKELKKNRSIKEKN